MWEYPKPISKECTQRILEQMNYFLFGKIKNTYQICFFTKINYIKRSKQLIINKDKSLNIFIDK